MSPSATLPRKVPRRCHQMVWVRWCETDGVKVDVTNFHACHAKRRWMSPSTTPTTQNEGACRQAPRLPRKVPRRHRRPIRAQARHQVQQVSRLPRKTKVDVTKCHACHEKRRWMSPSATPATQNEGTCRQVPRLPRKVPRRHRRPIRAKARPSAPPSATSATPATPNEGGCHQMPRLPRETKVHVAKCHACHARRRWMSPNATPATWNEDGCHQVPRLPQEDGVWQSCVWKMVVDKDVCERWWVTKLCAKDGVWQMVCELCVKDGVWKMVVDKDVCERWWVTKLCVKDGVCDKVRMCVKDGG